MEYEIGYKKPPKATRFQKGFSGNPKGRPKNMNINAMKRALEIIANGEADQQGICRIVAGHNISVRVIAKIGLCQEVGNYYGYTEAKSEIEGK